MWKKTLPAKYLSIPVIALIGASLLLFIILGVFTYQNFNRDTKLLKEHLFRQGMTLIRAIEAGARTGMMEMMWGENQVQRLFQETVKGPNIDRILLVDSTGQIITDSQPSKVANQKIRIPETVKSSGSIWMVLTKDNGEKIFRVMKKFEPMESRQKSMMGHMMGKMMGHWWKPASTPQKRFIILDLKMQEYEQARKDDFRMAFISGAILLILGSASFYFLIIVQNYYVVNRTLKTMESYTKNVVESMPNGLISLDEEGRIATINRNASRLLDIDPETAKGKYLSEIMPKCDIEKTLAPPEDIVERQVDCRLNNGRVIPVSITSSRLRDENGNEIGTVIILRDLRDIRSLEKKVERSERLASLGRMAAGIAHEIRNPLSSIKGFAQYFRNKFPEDSEDRNYAAVMVKEVDRLNRVIQDLLNFAKPQEPNIQPVAVQPLIHHALKLVESEIQDKKIQVIKDFPEQPVFTISADSDMLTQVLLNLFINAIEAMEPEGRLRIGIREDSRHLVIEIEDNGGGIPREHLPRIFDPFFTSKKSGTGLGLAIVYRIMESLHADIEVKSEVGKGTLFTLMFPKESKI